MAPSPRVRSPPEVDSGECKRFRLSSSLMDDFRGGSFSTAFDYGNERKGSEVSVEVIDHSDPYAVADLIREIDHSGMFGSVTKDIMDCTTRMHEVLGPIMSMSPWVTNALRPKEERDIFINENKKMVKTVASKSSLPILIIDSDDEEETDNMTTPSLPCQQVCLEAPVEQLPLPILPYQQVRLEAYAEQLPLPILPYRQVRSEAPAEQLPLPILPYRQVRLEEPDEQLPLPILLDQQVRLEAPVEKLSLPILPHQQIRLEAPVEQLPLPILPYQQVSLEAPVEQLSLPCLVFDHTNSKKWAQKNTAVGDKQKPGDSNPSVELGVEKGPNEFVGVEEDSSSEIKNEDDDGLGDIWTEMSFALECSKEASEDLPTDDRMKEGGDYCDHSFILKDDIGYVCRICGLIDKSIETIIEVQFPKAKRSTRTYISSESARDGDSNGMLGFELSEEDRVVTDLVPHPRHRKQMKAHQFEGFKFLCSNLVTDKPGGCILAHAPGSGKTFMIISFVQSFLAKNPQARPLVVMPKGILPTWKREFQTWQVEDIPLYDFYSVKADSRQQQLEVLKKWVAERSILFLGYQQFAKIVCEEASNKVATSCQEILLKRPSILILDEGHTPRNEKTDNLQSLAKVQTPRKVVLSGTLYQNHVKEVFNILNLVRPRFLKSEASQGIVRRIMSKVQIPSEKKSFRHGSDETFYDLVEHTIQKAPFKQKVAVIQDLREMTSKVLHYYRGDFLDELPGLVDFTVILNLSSRQKAEVHKLHSYTRKFKMIAVGSALYLHPKLNNYSEDWPLTDENMDKLLEGLYLEHGVKAKFFLNMLRLCESAKEKLLVFSQYLPPLKFLERLTMKIKGWALGREIFVISGESSTDQREWSMEKFNTSSDAKVFFGSIKACGEGISLVGASRIIILDVHLNPSVTRQAIGRAFRPGQKKKVHVYRLVAADSPEEEDHKTCFRKEVIAKMWFEWNERWGNRDFEVLKVELEECDDQFLESPPLREDVKVLYRR